MAKINLTLNNEAIIASDLTLEDFKELERLAPGVLTITEGNKDGEKEPVFTVRTGSNQISKYGIQFAKANRAGKAIASMVLGVPEDATTDEIKEKMADVLLQPFAFLQAIEEKAPEELERIKGVRAEFMDSITIDE